jgi:hypothetical protein
MILQYFKLLTRALHSLVILYREYYTLCEDQRQAAIHNNLTELAAVNEKIERVQLEIDESEQERLAQMQLLAENCDHEFVRIADLQQFFESTPELEALIEKTSELKTVLLKVKHANKINQGLIKASREFIRSNVGIITGYTEKKSVAKTRTYTKLGAYSAGSFQTRRLLNKEI